MPEILIIDDDRNILEMLEDVLGRNGYTIHTCRDGGNVLNVLEKENIDFMLVDVLLPRVNGFDLVQKMLEL